ncbi:GAF and ANTAR domain-containing protein [Pseudonocardia sp. KRD291]|uniref:GAF and ANTAR domain-containing protein n=1 Tax=Pseudonocardia sp. KRD291 TaxID=2792007 RepID=UPI001C4A312B|nr:GAF and ANTAR domain-containing protein [Pseudonocardia sp. KRD291]MBW0104379.1 GAF and ANTAR domain-containing protein [Pseudonocardia sp. KRD291]
MQPDQTDALVASLRKAAHDLVAHHSMNDLETTLGQIVVSAVDTVPGADAGGVSMTEDGHVGSRVPTNEDIRKLDQMQSQLHEGPCITALADPPEDGVVHAPDLAAAPDADRWPHFGPLAVEQGYRSMLSTQLGTTGGIRAALNLYSHEPDAFDDASRTVAGLFGVQAAILIYGVSHAAQLQQAIGTRDVIGQAKGILMERFDVDDDHAFQMLVRSSQETNLKLVDVARWLASPAGRERSGIPPTAG